MAANTTQTPTGMTLVVRTASARLGQICTRSSRSGAQPRVASRRIDLWRRTMKFLRRVHLYSGLALVPFVALYGVTAFLFNHPEVWSETSIRQVPAQQIDAAGRLPLSSPGQLATSIVAELGDEDWQLDGTTPPRFQGRSFLTATLDNTRYSFVIDEANGPARVFERPAPAATQSEREPIEPGDTSLEIGQSAVRSIEAAASALIASGKDEPEWRVRSTPRLQFGMLGPDAEPYLATYNLRDGSLEVTPTNEPAPARSIRSFLLRLHKAHTYPSGYGIRFWWALLVDIMAFAMVAWAVTGILMWWQMKNLRRIGVVTLAACAIGTIALTLAQWNRLG